MKRWDLLLAAGLVLLAVAAAAWDWRLGAGAAGVSLIGVWYWLGDAAEEG